MNMHNIKNQALCFLAVLIMFPLYSVLAGMDEYWQVVGWDLEKKLMVRQAWIGHPVSEGEPKFGPNYYQIHDIETGKLFLGLSCNTSDNGQKKLTFHCSDCDREEKVVPSCYWKDVKAEVPEVGNSVAKVGDPLPLEWFQYQNMGDNQQVTVYLDDKQYVRYTSPPNKKIFGDLKKLWKNKLGYFALFHEYSDGSGLELDVENLEVLLWDKPGEFLLPDGCSDCYLTFEFLSKEGDSKSKLKSYKLYPEIEGNNMRFVYKNKTYRIDPKSFNNRNFKGVLQTMDLSTGKNSYYCSPNPRRVEVEQASFQQFSQCIPREYIRIHFSESESTFYEQVEKKLDPKELSLLNLVELQALRNTVYAKNGHVFHTPTWKKYFEKRAWYNGRKQIPLSKWSKLDQDNFQLIQNAEKKLKKKNTL